MADPCFQIKGTSVTSMVLDLYHYQSDEFSRTLAQKVQTAPLFFTGSPLFLNLASFNGELSKEQLQEIIKHCQSQGFQLFGCKGGSEPQAKLAKDLGLVHLPASRARPDKTEQPPEQEPEPAASPAPEATSRPTRIIERPVRSGQQIYAEGSDLILLAQVSEGAEVIADGNIHAYGPLRGRALAGVRDNPNARIFCQQLEAELVSIAGHFVLNDTLRDSCWKQPAQIFLQDDSIEIAAL
ncbi:septum site-determining protein MinC [Gilvimarinus japonicus]|uniref:Probable septum site-determining protein MinC n=1 Tax=Gilvimarinus japonicus TaxID=1796469 RepID=A0ABV7HXA0_9GAMM